MRRAAKRDVSESAIVEFLRRSGWSVLFINTKDAPDILAGKHGVNVLIENKTGKAKLRPGQQRWADDWRGDRPYILRVVEDAAALNKAIDKLRVNR